MSDLQTQIFCKILRNVFIKRVFSVYVIKNTVSPRFEDMNSKTIQFTHKTMMPQTPA